jgi:serine/threonine protein kinase
LKSLSSNFIVRYTDFSIVHEGLSAYCVIVMEYCDGGDLRGKINLFKENKKEIDDSLVVIWMAQVGMALSFCHNRNIMHRDLKPENIFLMKDGKTCKLGDFGVAKALATTNAMADTMNIGTPMNFCPEHFKSQPYSNSADIWSFGCALFEAKFLYHPMMPQDGSAINMPKLSEIVRLT